MARVVLVTGGSGYFGSLLVDRLCAGGALVRNLDLSAPREQPAGAEHLLGDIRDQAVVRAACDGVDTVYHNVAQVPLAKDRELFESVNVGGTANLLVAARDAGVRKIVYTSSSAVFGIPDRNPVTETTPPRPLEPYGRAKLRGELLCRDAVDAGQDVTIVRPRTILGHGRLGIFALLFEWVREGAPLFVLGAGHNRYQFVHADDLAEACCLAGDRPGAAVYNVGAAEFGTMREALEGLVAHAGSSSRVHSLPTRPAVAVMRALSRLGLTPFAPYHWLLYGQSLWFDIDRARTELGWEPTYSNGAMLAESYDWYVVHRDELERGSGSHHQSLVRHGLLRAVTWAGRSRVLRAVRASGSDRRVRPPRGGP